MNGLIPALLIVLLAEIGGPVAQLARVRTNIIAFAIALMVFAAAGIGWRFAEMMVPEARLLMLGVLMILSGTSQIWQGKPARTTAFGTTLALSRASAPALAFGLAAWLGEPVTPALGALAAVALAGGAVALDVPVPPLARRVAGGILILIGAFAALRALQLL